MLPNSFPSSFFSPPLHNGLSTARSGEATVTDRFHVPTVAFFFFVSFLAIFLFRYSPPYLWHSYGTLKTLSAHSHVWRIFPRKPICPSDGLSIGSGSIWTRLVVLWCCLCKVDTYVLFRNDCVAALDERSNRSIGTVGCSMGEAYFFRQFCTSEITSSRILWCFMLLLHFSVCVAKAKWNEKGVYFGEARLNVCNAKK